MQNNYLLEGDNFLSTKKEIERIIKKNNFQEASQSTYSLSEVSLEPALEDLDTYGFLSQKKVIIIKEIDLINLDEEKKHIEHLYKYLDNPNPDNLLFICANKLNNTLKLTKELKKKMTYIEVSFNPVSFIKETLKDYQIDTSLVQYLSDKCLGDITRLDNECRKLKNYKNEDKVITKKDIDDLVIEIQQESSDLSFAFARSIARKDVKDALVNYRKLLEADIEPLNIIGLLASQIRIIYQVKVLEGMNSNDIATTLQEKNSYRVKKTMELTRYYTEKELLALMQELHQMDLKIKTSDVDAKSLLELFILNLEN